MQRSYSIGSVDYHLLKRKGKTGKGAYYVGLSDQLGLHCFGCFIRQNMAAETPQIAGRQECVHRSMIASYSDADSV